MKMTIATKMAPTGMRVVLRKKSREALAQQQEGNPAPTMGPTNVPMPPMTLKMTTSP